MRKFLSGLILLFAGEATAAIFVVNSTADTGGSTCASSCTLRQAINAANATAAADTINFSFPVIGGFERLIQPATPLPTITGPVTINGYSVIGSRENDDLQVSNAQLRIRLDGLNAPGIGLRVCSSDVAILGLSITRFTGQAIAVGSDGSLCGNFQNVRISGNFVGLTTSGSGLAANDTGVFCAGSACTIGDGTREARNVIAGGNFGVVVINPDSDDTLVAGNLFGTDKSGQFDRGIGAGVALGAAASGVRVGAPGETGLNRLRFNGAGIVLQGAGAGNQLAFNAFGGNDGLGIDLGGNGVTPNDTNDGDPGPNDLQNFPALTAASRTAGGLSLSGTLDVGHSSAASYMIAAYASSSCDASGHGEGERLLGFVFRNFSATAENFTESFTTGDPLPPGTVITATATGSSIGTSEFSACFALDPPPLVVNSGDDVADGVCNATHCSLRDALIVANGAATGSTIEFAIPPLAGTSEIMIQPASPLPTITKPVLIDGYTQPGTAVNTDPEVSNAQLRIRLDGANAGATSVGLSVCADDVTVRGLSLTRFGQAGVAVGRDAAGLCGSFDNVRVAGNFVGLAADGTSSDASSGLGVLCFQSPCFIGGVPSDRNVFGGGSVGIQFVNPLVAGSVVAGNLIGTDRSGLLDRGYTAAGIAIGIGSDDVTIGTASAPNRIRFSSRGISVSGTGVERNAFALNRFDANDGLAIDLGDNGVTQNDLDDADGPSPNGLQNFPVLNRAERVPGTIVVRGSLDVKAGASNAPYAIAVYANAACDPSGNGEGATLLGSQVVNLTQGSGESFSFSLNTPVDLVANPAITTTATSDEGTSEFSACVNATDPPDGIVVDSATDSSTLDGGCDIAGDGNTCTFREAITLANTQAGTDSIRFAIPGDGPHAIAPVAVLPAITEGLEIDGYSEEGAAPNGAATGSDAVLKIELRATGLANALRVCTTGLVAVRGIAFSATGGISIETQRADSGSCLAAGSLEVEGSFFGMTAGGSPLAAAAHIQARNTLTSIGGPGRSLRNVFANAGTFGVRIEGAGSNGSRVNGNLFGRTVAPELPAANGSADLLLVDVQSVDVGGDAANAFRTTPTAIAVNAFNTARLSFWNNSFSDHTGSAAIDLGINGITPNDADDADTGANEGQNTPVLAVASATGTDLTVNGALDVPAGIAAPAPYRLAFYESATCNDASGAGNGREGQILLGSVLLGFTSSAESFSVTLPVPPIAPGRFLTATATNPDGSTSEFSNCLAAPQPDVLLADGFE